MVSYNDLKNNLLKLEGFEDNQYLLKYCKLISHNELILNHYEKHHIIPKCYFKLRGLPIDNTTQNICKLSCYNHILAHYYLVQCTSGQLRHKLLFALSAMCNQDQSKLTLTEKEFIDHLPGLVQLREEVRILLSIKSIERFKHQPGTFKGKHHTEETKKAARLRNLGKHYSPEVALKRWRTIREKGGPKPMTPESKDKISQSNREKFTGHVWITNGKKDKHIDPLELETWEAQGFKLGRINKQASLTKEGRSKLVTKLSNKVWMTDNQDNEIRVDKELVEEYLNLGYRLGMKQHSNRNKGPSHVKNKIWIHKDSNQLRIPAEDLNKYLDSGWSKGRRPTIYICNKDGMIRIQPNELEKYLALGYQKGKVYRQ